MKELLSVLAVLLTFVAYISYYRDIFKGKTHPHIYSWFLWGLLTALIVGLQIKGGAGSAIWVTIAAGIACIGVIVFGFKNGKKYITKFDTVVSVLALLAIGFWLVVDQPIISILLVVIADTLAFLPTVRKSWDLPYTETTSLYVVNTIRFILALLAVEYYTILSSLWLVVMTLMNGLIAVMLVIRRRQLPIKNT